MTSKKSSVNPLLFTYKQGLKGSAGAPAMFNAIMFFFFGVLSVATQLFGVSNNMDSMGNVIGSSPTKDRYTYLFLPMSDVYTIVLIASCVIMGILAAIFAFKFITSKKAVNVYYSLGITRKKLFAGTYLSGATLMLLSVLVPMTIILFINMSALGVCSEMLAAYFFLTLAYFAVMLVAFSVTAAVMSAVGTNFEAAVFGGILVLLPTIIFSSLESLMKSFLYGNPYGVEFNIANVFTAEGNTPATVGASLSFLNPIIANLQQMMAFSALSSDKKTNPALIMADVSVGGTPSFLTTLLWLAICAAVFFIGMRTFMKRKAEICGFIGTNKVLNTVGAFAVGFFSLCLTINRNGSTLVIRTVCGFLLFAALYVLIESLLLRDTRKLLKSLKLLPAELLTAAALILVFYTGLFGFTMKVPELSEVESVGVTFAGAPDEYVYSSNNFYDANLNIDYAPGGAVVQGFKTESDLKRIIKLHEDIATTGKNGGVKETVQFVYKLKDGTALMRSFNRVNEDNYETLLKLEESDLYKERLDTVFNGEIDRSTERKSPDATILTVAQTAIRENSFTVYSPYLDKSVKVELNSDLRESFVKTLYNDLNNRTVEQKYYPKSTPYAYISFGMEGDYVSDEATEVVQPFVINSLETNNNIFRFDMFGSALTVAVTADMTDTIAFLDGLKQSENEGFAGITDAPGFVSATIVKSDDVNINENVDSLLNSTSSYFHGVYIGASAKENNNFIIVTDTANKTEVTDEKLIAELVSGSSLAYETVSDSGYYVVFKTSDGSSVTSYLPENSIPAGIKRPGN